MPYIVENLQKILGQQIRPLAPPQPQLPSRLVDFGIIGLGIAISTLGYNARKTDLGTIGMGAGSSIAGAGVVLLILDLAGFKNSSAA